jgi:hypothetical protein
MTGLPFVPCSPDRKIRSVGVSIQHIRLLRSHNPTQEDHHSLEPV